MKEKINLALLEILKDSGIQPTKGEFDDFVHRLVNKLWNKITKERMDEILITKNAVEAVPIVLPNGRVGEQYHVDVPFIIENLEEYTIIGLDAVGLTFEKNEQGFSISGTA